MTTFEFRRLGEDGRARVGEIHTPRGIIRTPAFMPVGTVATVKAMLPGQVRETGADVLLGNTYHLMLRPGAERIARLGGLHDFMRWPHPILTDSGGYQVMSLGNLVTMTEKGVTFASHLDGTRYELSPERAIEIQGLLGSDIQMQLDECTAYPASHEVAKRSLELSLRWADRSKAAFAPQAPLGRALFGIVQGSTYPDLREQSARALVAMDMHGYSVGGLAVGEPQAMMFEILEATVPFLPREKPRYLMGVGKPDDILGAVERGIDMFDCVLPTRSGRHGQAFTRFGPLNLKNARHADDPAPIDPESDCPASRDYSRAYLHHLIRAGEILGAILVSWSNLAYYQALMADIRAAIAAGRLTDRAAEIRAAWANGERDVDISDEPGGRGPG